MSSALGAASTVLAVFAWSAAASAAPLASAPAQSFAQESERAAPTPAAPQPGEPRTPSALRPALAEGTDKPSAAADRTSRERLASDRTPGLAPPQVAVYGDRMGQALAGGLAEARGSAVAVARYTADDAGLARPDFDSWLRSIRESLAKPDRPSLAVMLVGSNDRRPLGDGHTTADPGTPRWQAIYESRVDAVAAAFREARVALIWVGLPAVRNDQASADFVRLNGIIRERAAKDGVTYVDSWEAFTDDAGRYSPMGPDVEGQTVRLRKGDGFGFTRAGAAKLASFVDADVTRLAAPAAARDPASVDVAHLTIDKARDFDSALAIDVNAQIRREAAPAGKQGLEPEAAAKAEAPQGAVAGPVIALTAPPSSPGGRLATAASGASLAAGAMQANLVLPPPGEGQPVPPKPGRTDDFSWPKP